MNGYFITGIAAGVLGIALGIGGTHFFDANRSAAQLATEKAAHAKDNEQHANDLTAISKAALDAENRAIDAHTKAETQLAALDSQLNQEKEAHETDNAKNLAALADGSRRLRIAVSNFQPAGGGQTGTASSAGSVGDGAGGTAELSPAFGLALFSIVDDADADRAKITYLQGYVCAVRPGTPGCAQ